MATDVLFSETFLSELSDEADLCRNDGAEDIARLLDRAANEIKRRDHLIEDALTELARLRSALAENDELIAAQAAQIEKLEDERRRDTLARHFTVGE